MKSDSKSLKIVPLTDFQNLGERVRKTTKELGPKFSLALVKNFQSKRILPQSFPLQNLSKFLMPMGATVQVCSKKYTFWSGKLWGIGKGSLSWFYCKSFCIFVKNEEFCIFWHQEKDFILIFSIFCKFLKTPYLTRRIWGKMGVPNNVNDTVAPWGLLLQKFCAC